MTRSRLFTILVLATLAIGIGASAAIFTLADGLLRPLPFDQPERLVVLWEGQAKPGLEEMHVSPPNFEDWVARSHSFESLTAYDADSFNLTGEGQAERILGATVSNAFFRALRAELQLGRGFSSEDDSPGAPLVVILSHGLWQRRFAGSTDVLGQSVRVNGEPATIVGVVAQGHEFPRRAQLWLPLDLSERNPRRDAHSLKVLGRLGPGVTLPSAQNEMTGIARQLAEEYPESNKGWFITLKPLSDELLGDTRSALWLLVAAVGLLLVISCVNVAGLLIARGLERAQELAIRQAFGASKRRLFVQLTIENLFFGLVAAAVAAAFAWALLGLFTPLLPASILGTSTLAPGGKTLGFALLLGVATLAFFGLFPAVWTARKSLAETLGQGGRTVTSGGKLPVRSIVVVAEFALTFALVVSAMALGRNFIDLVQTDPGFTADSVLTARLGLDTARYDNPQLISDFFDQATESLRGLPGVDVVAATDALPLSGSTEGTVFLPEGAPMPDPGDEPVTRLTVISEDYFDALGIELIAGRDFSSADISIDPDCECVAPNTVPTVIVNEKLAENYWPGEPSVVGRRMKLGDLRSELLFEVIGVAADAHYDGLASAVRPRTYVFDGQFPVDAMTLMVRTQIDPTHLAGTVRRELGSLDTELPVYHVSTLTNLVDGTMARQRLLTFLIGAFTVVALILSMVGLYGLMMTNVARRSRELGIHIALGVDARRLLWLVLRRALALGLMGIAAGLLLAWTIGRAADTMLPQFLEINPSFLVSASLVLFAATLVGALIPALRAVRLDATTALRQE